MKKLLTILGSLTMIGTAGATVVACGNKQEATPKTPLETLTALISDAEALIKDKEGEAVDTLMAAIADAKQVADNKESTEDQIKEATNKLEAAIKTYNDSTSTNLTEKLSLTIQAGTKALIDHPKKVQAAKTTLIKAIDNAVTVLAKHENDKQLTDAISTLEAAIKTYNEAADGGETDAPNIKNLALKITEATEVFNNNPNKVQAAKKILVEAIGVATSVIANPQNQGQVDAAVGTLQTAIDTFTNSDEENTDNQWFDLQAAIVNLEEKLDHLVNLDPVKDPTVKLARQILKQIKEINVAASKDEIVAGINNSKRILEQVKAEDLTDFGIFDKAKENYENALKKLINPVEEQKELNEKIKTTIEKDEDIIKNKHDEILTKEIQAMADEVNGLVDELVRVDTDSTELQTEMRLLTGNIVKLFDTIDKDWRSNEGDDVLFGFQKRAKELAEDASNYLEELAKNEEPVKAQIKEEIEKFQELFNDLSREYNEHKNPKE